MAVVVSPHGGDFGCEEVVIRKAGRVEIEEYLFSAPLNHHEPLVHARRSQNPLHGRITSPQKPWTDHRETRCNETR